MEEILIVLKHMQQKNHSLHEYIIHFQSTQILTLLKCVHTTPPHAKEPRVSLLDKFEGMCSKYQGFFNQVHLVTRFH
jgi:hypothetical protein